MKRLFSSTNFQKSKNELIDSMNFHLTKYRPKVKMSNNKESKSHELSSYKILGQ